MRIAFNYSPALAIATEREYSMELFITLMQVIEAITLSHDAEVRDQERQRNSAR